MVNSAFRLGNVSELSRSVFLPSCSLTNSRKIVAKSGLFQEMWLFGRKGPSGFSSASTAEEVTNGIDASGLTAIVTGASSGIGSETARVLALRGVHVVMGVRNMAAGKEVKETIVKQIPAAKVDAMELDLSSLASVRKFASEFTSSGRPLNILMAFSSSKFAIGHHEKKSSSDEKGGEDCECFEEGIRFDRLNDREEYSRRGAYGQSKLANVLHAKELARRLKDEGADITANSLHPGVITTNLFRHLGVFEGNLGIFEGKSCGLLIP
ncbi:UNVERIFIED_CONTAM: Short-chain dehydrogenase, chloroplastic [Sesamum latifolium]|uniref:Short-chain dehydrogenase, chloroplastic n=1 Tax=Sesamum latifolium TaxID=2727402 RepID=A0AAW2XFH1_9LAMI